MAQDAGGMVVVFSSTTHEAELEANTIHALLEANGVESILAGPSVLPVFEFQVLVPRERLEEARQIITDAVAAGPEAAAEGEAATE